MGQKVTKTDFDWVYDEEPHKSRRTEILKKYPGKFIDFNSNTHIDCKLLYMSVEIKQLFGYDPMFKWYCSALVLSQVASLYYLQNKSWQFLLVTAYCFGGVVNHSLSLAVHEIAHNLSFGHAR